MRLNITNTNIYIIFYILQLYTNLFQIKCSQISYTQLIKPDNIKLVIIDFESIFSTNINSGIQQRIVCIKKQKGQKIKIGSIKARNENKLIQIQQIFIELILQAKEKYNKMAMKPVVVVKAQRNKNGYAFAVILFLYQILVCLIYGFLFDYHPVAVSALWDEGHLYLVAMLTVLAIVGFGLVNAYITNASFSGMGFSLLIFGITVESYFLMKAFWEKAGTSDPYNSKSFQPNHDVSKITFTNVLNDRYNTAAGTIYEHSAYFYYSYSFVDAIACAICNIIIYSSVVGRIKALEVFFLSVFGTFIYIVNEQLIFRYAIGDTGFGMRIFIYGAFAGLISSIILGKKDTTINNIKYMSVYASRGMSLLGLLVQFCTFPCLVAGSLYTTSINNTYVLYSSVLRMFLALVAGILGSFSASAITYRKIMIHDLVFGGLAGGIVYSSSADLHPNPGVPLGAGFMMGFAATIYHSAQLRRINKNGVVVSLTHIDRFVIPGLFCGFLSAILYAIAQGDNGGFILNRFPGRSNIGQGGMQLAGIGLSIAIGIFAGLLIGLLYKLINRNEKNDQFNDAALFRPDFPPSTHFIDWKEI